MTGKKFGDIVYDTFISYHEADKQWVTERLIRHLEKEGINVCWDDRDFEPGKSVIENKLNSLCSSLSIIVVLSPEYVEQETLWSVLQENCRVDQNEILAQFHLIPIYLRPCEIPPLFASLWKLDWTNKAVIKYFWEKLLNSVKKSLQGEHQFIFDNNGRCANVFSQNRTEKIPASQRSIQNAKYINTEMLSVRENEEQTLESYEIDGVKKSIVTKDTLIEAENDWKSEASGNKFLEQMNPRILSLFVPEDDDLTKQDIEELTFKIENVNFERNQSYSGDESVDDALHAKIPVKKCHFAKKRNLPKFDSQQEQILMLDMLQERDMEIKRKFENCCACGKKRVYRRLLERLDKAICTTVNGEKDALLLASLPIAGVSLDEGRGYRCSCCDQLFHSERALQLHIEECVRNAWISLLNDPTYKWK